MKTILFRLCLIFSLIFCVNTIFVPPSFAEVRQHEFVPGEMIYQSRQSMRDIDRRPWQVVLFKKVRGEAVSNIELRLVGFPDQIEFNHPDALLIHTRTGQDFQAVDQFAENAPTPNVGQYDVTDILEQLPTDEPIVLELPTKQNVILKIPVSVVLEWKLIA
ncbi:MAG: DUF3122 domain-containing protein [Limnothrix sp. RL_2_0]|nr:DUF3122 domain-containing protein [Limnothrix sp. RL_2_0]